MPDKAELAPESVPNVRGWITPAVAAFAAALCRPAETIVGRRLVGRAQSLDPNVAARRARRVDTFVAACVLIELAAFVLVTSLDKSHSRVRTAMLMFVCYQSAFIPANAAKISLFDRLKLRPGLQPLVASHERVIVLGFVNFLELIVCFATIYAFNCNLIGGQVEGTWVDPLHLSAVSQLTIGYGDIYPTKLLRLVSWWQGISSLTLLVLLIGRFIAMPRFEKSIDEVQRFPEGTSSLA